MNSPVVVVPRGGEVPMMAMGDAQFAYVELDGRECEVVKDRMGSTPYRCSRRQATTRAHTYALGLRPLPSLPGEPPHGTRNGQKAP